MAPNAFRNKKAATFVAIVALSYPRDTTAFGPRACFSPTTFSTRRRRLTTPQRGERDLERRPGRCRRTVPESDGAGVDALFFRPGTGDDDAAYPAGPGPVKVAAAIAEPESPPTTTTLGRRGLEVDPVFWERARRELEATAAAAAAASKGGKKKKNTRMKKKKKGEGATDVRRELAPTSEGNRRGRTVRILKSVAPTTVGEDACINQSTSADLGVPDIVEGDLHGKAEELATSASERKKEKTEKTKRAASAKIIAPAAVATSRRKWTTTPAAGEVEEESIAIPPSGVNSSVRTNGALSARRSSSRRDTAVESDSSTSSGVETPPTSPPPIGSSGSRSSSRVILSREEEAELVERIRALRVALDRRGDLEALNHQEVDGDTPQPPPRPPTEAEWASSLDPPLTVEDLRRTVREGREARATLLAANEGLVVRMASRYARDRRLLGSALTLQDMIQEGRMGMMEAAERFDPARSNGARFATYAAFWVRQRILRCIANHSRAIRLPEHVHGLLHSVNRARREMTDEIGRVPTLPELAHRLEMPVERLRSLEESSRHVVSLEVPLNPTGSNGRGRGGGSSGVRADDGRALGDGIASDGPTPEDHAEEDGLRGDVRAVMGEQLRENERDVLALRYGLDDGDPRTLDEVARSLGVSRERARLIEARALNKLRHPGRNHRLKEYVAGADDPDGEPTSPSEEDRLWFF